MNTKEKCNITHDTDNPKQKCRFCKRDYYRNWASLNYEKRQQYRQLNKDKIKEQRSAYIKNNREKMKAQCKKWYQNNLVSVREYSRKYSAKLEVKERSLQRYKENRSEKIKEMIIYNKSYEMKRRNSDPLYRLSKKIRSLISIGLKSKGYKKKSKVEQILGASFEIVQNHLILSAIRNYGHHDVHKLYHIDHIIPCSSAATEFDLIKLQHYTNLQYLTPEDNLAKSDKLDWNLQIIQNKESSI